MKKYSIIIPTYNEKENIKLLVSEIEKTLGNLDYEIIFVDDSTDGTEKVIENIAKDNEKVTFKHRTKEKGLSSAVIEGINMANSDIISVMDADLQHPPYLLKNMYEEVKNGADFCIPSRFIPGGSDGGLNLYRKFVSWVARKLGQLSIFHLRKVTDITSGLFCFRKSNLDKTKKLNPIGWKIMLEVLAKSHFKKIVEIPYTFNKRHGGESKMSKKIMLEYLEQLKILRKEKTKNKYEVEKKIESKYKYKKLYHFAAFIIPIIVMFIILCVKGVWLDSDKLAFGDMQAQYIDMLIYIRSVILGKNNLLYSITKGVGGSIYSTFAYYMVSPFNLLLILVKVKDIMKMVYVIILLKVGMAGLTMSILLDYKNNKNKVLNLALSLCYPLMAFVVCTYFCIMWQDAIYMAPLVVLGINKLVNEDNVKFYMITLFITIIFNFYLGYITCIFSVLYFIYLMVTKYSLKDGKKIINKSLKFFVSSLVAGLLAAFIWLPSIIEMLKTARGDVASETTFGATLNTIFIGSYNERTMLFYYQPEIYCGMLVLFGVIAHITNKKNNNFHKAFTIAIFGIFFASILIKGLSYVWHGFSYPIGYNFRFTYLLCLFAILVAHKELTSYDKLRKFQILSILVLLIIGYIYIRNNFNEFGGYLSLGLILLYTIIMASTLDKNAKSILFLVIVVIELGINAGLSFFKAENVTTFENYVNDICSNFDYDENTYRVNGYDYYGTDALIACNKSSTNGFYSTLNSNIVNFYQKVGLSGGANVYNDNLNNTPIVDALLGVKYFYNNQLLNNYKLIDTKIITKREPSNGAYYEEKNYIYENPYYLNLGYLIDDYKKISSANNAFEYQNEMFKTITGISPEINILNKIDTTRKNNKLKDSTYIYIQALSDNNGIKINGVDYMALNPGEIFAIENTWHKDEISIEYDGFGDNKNSYLAYYLDTELFKEKIEYLRKKQIQNVKINNSNISFDIDVEKDGKLMLAIPYEKDWDIYVDGKKTNYTKLYEMFIGIDLKSNKHKVVMKYRSKTILYGMIISILDLPIFIILINENRKESSNEKERHKRK